MQVILLEDVQHLGEMGDLVKVKPGYGRNYLIPRGLALPATKANKSELAHRQREIAARKERQQHAAMSVFEKIDNLSLTVPKRVGDEDKLYGSVTNREIADLLAEQGYEIDRRQILVDQQISELGIYKVPVKLASGVVAHVNVWVVAM